MIGPHSSIFLHVENEISQNLRFLNTTENYMPSVFFCYYCLFFLMSICVLCRCKYNTTVPRTTHCYLNFNFALLYLLS